MTAGHQVHFSAEAERGLSRLPVKVALAIVEFVMGPLASDPLRLSKPLRNELAGIRSARRGDYRVLVEVDEAERTVMVVRIAHRADVYR